MTCREFTRKIEGLRLTELDSAANAELLAHENGCVSCAALLQQRHSLAGAMQVLRSGTAVMQAPIHVEHEVLRAFRQTSALQLASESRTQPQRWGFRLSNFFGWRAYAAAAAALAIGLGLGMWFARRSDTIAQQPTAKTEQSAKPSIGKAEDTAPLPVQASVSDSNKLSPVTNAAGSQHPSATTASLTQSEQVQGYTPLMLCDPISCSGDEEVVRMELPATAADGSTESQMADVIVGDDGLVRAIRIVQPQ
jgi:hypothetical protein